jgi:valyl-tRNA synthetase
LKSVQGKLSNEKFVNGAPEKVLANERQKESDALAKLKQLSKVWAITIVIVFVVGAGYK